MKPRSPSRPAALLLAALVALIPAAPARAHARLLASDPVADSAVPAAPTAITLTFDGPVQPGFTTVTVAGTDGTPYGDGAPTATGHQVRQNLGRLPRGRVQVTWRTVAADGAPLQGRFAFTNDDPNAPAQPRPARPHPRPHRRRPAGRRPPVRRTGCGGRRPGCCRWRRRPS
ncbi:copper resistance CopC family protein [Kitasatospora cheerisanensis]|uniref:copper resistance CopC family protein n=1 Tax=Kitasatospora cheerisanensis TaxID=81942 RepID=UPI00068E0E77|nr:copper resistance CopC family protein [Kitasatospora cheerisanensis]